MLKIVFLSVLFFVLSGNVGASENIEELDFSRKGVVSCETKEIVLKYRKGEALSICDVIDQVKEKIEDSKSYSLNLQDNSIDNKAALEILKFVKVTPQVKRLDLSYNRITQILDATEIESICASFIAERKDCQVILTGNNLSFHFDEEEDDAPKKIGSNIIIEAF